MLEESEEDRTLRELFNLFDVNGNGVLEKEELREAFLHFTGHACSDEELERLEATADIDGDRQISFPDFVVFCRIAKFTLEFGVPGRLSYGALTWTAPTSTSSSQRELWIKFCCGAVAGGISRTAVAPLERLKILLQTNTAGSDASQGTFRALARMWRAEGLQGLFRGNGVNVLRVAPASAVQFMANDEFKRLWAAVKGGSAADVDALTFSERVLAGSFAGALSSALTYPADLLRAKLTVERGAGHSSLAAIATATFRAEGVRGFYKGMVPTIAGVMPYGLLLFSPLSILQSSYLWVFPPSDLLLFSLLSFKLDSIWLCIQ